MCAASNSTTARSAPGGSKAKLGDIRGGHPFPIVRVLIPAFSRSFPDTTRGVLNEGGLFGERAGWHLPGFDTSSWVKRDLSAGLPDGAAGVGFFVTTFPLNIPAGFDVMLSFTFNESFQPYRAFLFVNGWMMGKRVANLGCAVFTNLRPRTGTLLTYPYSHIQTPIQVSRTPGYLRLQRNQVRHSHNHLCAHDRCRNLLQYHRSRPVGNGSCSDSTST